ncbi:MAG: ABC transporter substrate-binding protein [Chloroflexota bacterium]
MRKTQRIGVRVVPVLLAGYLALGGTAGLGHGTAAGLQHASIVLDWYPNSDHGGLYTAIRQGFFRKAGIDMTARVPSDTSAQIRLVAAGAADFGISYETDLLAARAHRIPVRSVMCIMQHPLDTVMTLRTSGITRPRRLAGHSVGMAGSPSDEPIVSAMMTHDGSSIGRAHMVNVGYNLLPALLSKKVDAIVGVYWTWEAIQARQRGYAVNVMRVERWGVPNYCELVLVVSERTIRTRPGFVRATVQALQKGYRLAEARPEIAVRSLSVADRTYSKGRNKALVLESIRLLRSVVGSARTIGYQSPPQWRHYAGWLARNKLIDGRVDARAAFTNQFLGQIR